MKIIGVKENKKQYLDLLLLADEQENMIDRYLDKGKMYVLDDNGIKCECIVTDEGSDVLEIKNIATVPDYQGKGYAKSLIDFIVEKYSSLLFCLISINCPTSATNTHYEKQKVKYRPGTPIMQPVSKLPSLPLSAIPPHL